MKTYRFRILLDSAQHVFRDIEISAEGTFLQLHEAIVRSFAFSGHEMASFYLSNDEWDKGEEIALMDFSEPGAEKVYNMEATTLSDMVVQQGDKLLYLYDFLRMWIWYVELIAIEEAEEGADYPRVVLAVGDAPDEYAKAMVERMGDGMDMDEDFSGDFDDDFDEDDFESFDTFDEDSFR